MMNIFAHYWGWLLLITAIGFIGGMMVHPDEEDRGLPVWFWPLAVLLVLGYAAAQFGFVDEPYSVWIGFAALGYAGFTIGALAGGFGKKFGLRWGPLLVSILVGTIGVFMTPATGLFPSADKPAETAAATPAPDAAQKAADEAKAAAVKAEEDAKAVAAKAEEDAKAAAAKAEEEAKAAAAKAEEEAKAAAAKAAEEAKAVAAKAEEEAKAVAPAAAPETLADKKTAAIAAAAALPAKGPLDAAQCQTALSGLVAKDSVKFTASSAKLAPESKPLIASLGAALARCPASVKVEVSGYTDNSGDAAKNKALSKSRAQAVVDALKAKGAKAGQLSAVGYGPDKPVASNDTAEGKADNRRIEFSVK
jgi:outer membrane protein OmpA-like peptidoglycan-associated protein